MDPDQTVPRGSGSTLFVIEASKTFRQRKKLDDMCCDWRFEGYFHLMLLLFQSSGPLLYFDYQSNFVCAVWRPYKVTPHFHLMLLLFQSSGPISYFNINIYSISFSPVCFTEFFTCLTILYFRKNMLMVQKYF